MKMLRKIIHCESFEISQENFDDALSFCKVASLQCSDGNFAISRTYRRYFLEHVPKTSCPKRNKKRKSISFEEKVYGGSAS